MAIVDVDDSSQFSADSAQVNWLGPMVGGHPAHSIHSLNYYHFASAADAVDSSHMTASSSASSSRFSPPQILLMGTCRQRGSWSVAGHNQRNVIGQDPICAS